MANNPGDIQGIADSTHEEILMANAAPLVESNVTKEIIPPEEPLPEWKPGRQEYQILISLSIISLVVALDASIVAPALTVSHPSLVSLQSLSKQRSQS